MKKKYLNFALKAPSEEIEPFINEILGIEKISKSIYEELYPKWFFGNFKLSIYQFHMSKVQTEIVNQLRTVLSNILDKQ